MLTRDEILTKLKEIFLQMDPTKKDIIDSLSFDSRLREDLGLMSVSMLYMVIAIEETFGIEFSNLGVEDFLTVGQTIDYIEEKLKG